MLLCKVILTSVCHNKPIKFMAPFTVNNLIDRLRVILILSGPDSSVGIAAAYGLDGPGIESRWGRNFPHQGPPSLLYNGYQVFPGGKVRPGRDADPSTPSSAEVKNRVELYLYSP